MSLSVRRFLIFIIQLEISIESKLFVEFTNYTILKLYTRSQFKCEVSFLLSSVYKYYSYDK